MFRYQNVSIHAPTRGATIPNPNKNNVDFVSIHAPTRGATETGTSKVTFELFQSTHPHGVRRTRQVHHPYHRCFNPRTHTGCDSRAPKIAVYCSGFNPRTHTGCDIINSMRATSTIRFNPRTHTGCDIQTDCVRCEFDVSIHAPTRGATIPFAQIQPFSTCFNPRTHTGCDLLCKTTAQKMTSFNPRTHTGCDIGAFWCIVEMLYVSIHAPTRGATWTGREFKYNNKFQSTHPHGVRQDALDEIKAAAKVSIHAPTRGATSKRLSTMASGVMFQSTHPHGVRQ